MKFGAEPKKLALLGGLVLLGGYFFYSNVLSGPSGSDSTPSRSAARPDPAAAPVSYGSTAVTQTRRSSSTSRTSEDFRPSLKPKRPEERVDPMTIDPTLRLDLLAKVQGVEMQGGARNLFKFSTAPPPPLPKEPIVKPKTPAQIQQEQVAAAQKAQGPPPAPPPPPILLKYYGYSSAKGDNRKRAFFLDGDEILMAGEGEVVKKRYKVVRIGVNSVVMEDTQFKHEQTLPLQEEAAG
ncbi:MAG: hypothetical protein U0Q18_34590 [Bryobacteraceae bacterium]